MKNRIVPFLLLAPLMLVGCQKSNDKEDDDLEPIGEKIEYRVAVSDTSDVGDYLYYTDDYFDKPASEFSISFSNASLGVVEGTSPSIVGGDQDYSKKYQNGESLLEKMGFTGISHNSAYEKKPEENTVGAIYGHKDIKGSTLILLAIRSINYQLEWVDQFLMGEEGDHQGFANARDTIFIELKGYITEQNISGHIKLWVVGHSRGGTIANLIGGQLDIDLINNVSTFGNDITFNKDDLYIQCFNPVMATTNTEYQINGERFNNIQCFANFDDLISYLSPVQYGFKRFGTTYYLPNAVSSLDYLSMSDAYDDYYNNHTNLKNVYGEPVYSHISPYKMKGTSYMQGTKYDDEKINWSMSIFAKDFMDELAEKVVLSRENYVAKWQTPLRKAIKYLFTRYSGDQLYKKDFLTLLSELQNNAFDSKEESDAFTNTVMTGLNIVNADNSDLLATAMGGILNNIQWAHRSCLVRVWFKIMDINYVSEPIKYNMRSSMRKIVIQDGSVNAFDYDIIIKDNSGKELVKFFAGEPEKVNSKCSYGLYKNVAHIYLPTYGQYTLDLSQYDENREVNFTLSEYNIDTSIYKKTVDNNYSLTKGTIQVISI